jgi:SpoIID/LytB domain protein
VVVGELRSGKVETVNRLPMESYLRSVVPAEMPASWPAAALQAQAIAARTYADRGIAHPKASWFDLFGDTRDQAYLGVPHEADSSTAAVKATARQILTDSTGAPILAQYCSSDGGWTASGGVSYLPAQHDPYDGAIANDAHSWRLSLSAASIVDTYPRLGTLKDIVVTGRQGDGQWGGRVTRLTLIGTRTSVSLTGEQFQSAFGLRSTWWRPTPPPATPAHVTASRTKTSVTVSWTQPASVKGAAAVSGYVVTVSGADKVIVASNARSATVTGVTATSGTATVRALSQAGKSEPGRGSY